MKFMKRAQASVETLLIYGVTLLIVMLAIGALIGFGVLDLGGLLPDKCEINNALTCENYAVASDKVQLELKNVLGENIANFSVYVYGEDDNEGLWGCPSEVWYSEGKANHILVNGVTSDVVEIPCDIQVPSGKKISGIIEIEINQVGSKISRTVTGSIRATVS